VRRILRINSLQMCFFSRRVRPQVIVWFAVTDDMYSPSADSPQQQDGVETVRRRLERCLAGDELAIPSLPEVAVRVVGTKGSPGRQWAEIEPTLCQ